MKSINQKDHKIDKLINLSNVPKDNKDAAEQGFTLRNGYNPNKPHPFEEKDRDKNKVGAKVIMEFNKNKFLEDTVDDFDNEGNLIYENDELDNPSD